MTKMNYPVTISTSVAWGEMDAFNHVNNIIYFRYFENARIKYFETLALMETMQQTGVGPILAHTACQYIKPVQYPDVLRVSARVKSMGTSSFVMEYLVESPKLGKAALGSGVIVMMNYRTSEKVAIPDKVRQKIMALEGDNLEA